MTISIRTDDQISDVEGGWFRARWHYSFDSYRDPEYVSFGSLRVFNDDRLVPGAIWPMHPHRDIEGLTYVVEGSFRHEDDVGGAPGPLPAGSVQRMTLGMRGSCSPFGSWIASRTWACWPSHVARPGASIRVMISRWSRRMARRTGAGGKP